EGVVTSSVIMFHVFFSGNATPALFLNEFCIICIGIGVALLVNLYMPNYERELIADKARVEDLFRVMLQELATLIEQGNSTWTGKELDEAGKCIARAKKAALLETENHVISEDAYYYHYFAFRERQYMLIEGMFFLASSLNDTEKPWREGIATFLRDMSVQVNDQNTASALLVKLNSLRAFANRLALPETLAEFHNASRLDQLLDECEHYIMMKSAFFGGEPERKTVRHA
ncbi:MAG: aromatic acid exporter family protein, partial [Bacilli bacterium]